MLEEKCKHLGLKLSRNWCSAISVDEDEQKYLVRCQILELESRLAMRDPRVRGWRRIENHFRMALQRQSSRYQFWSQSTVIFECWQAAHVGLSCRCVSVGRWSSWPVCPKIGEIVILFRVAWSSSSSSSSSQSLGLFLVCISANKDMERVNIRQQNLDELYQTPENTLESKHPRPTFLPRPPVPACRSTNFSLFSSWGT
jgi:hypothetical protein